MKEKLLRISSFRHRFRIKFGRPSGLPNFAVWRWIQWITYLKM